MMTSGRKRRITQTISPRMLSWPHFDIVSSAVLENPKSMARVKNCSAPSIRRAASSSWVRMTPSSVALFRADQVLAAFARG